MGLLNKIGNAIGDALEVGARQLEKDYERGQEVSTKKDLYSYEAEIKQKLQDRQNEFTRGQAEMTDATTRRGQDITNENAAAERELKKEEIDIRRKEVERREMNDERRHQENMARLDSQIRLMQNRAKMESLGPTVIGDDGVMYERTQDGMRPVPGPDGKPFKPIAKTDDPKSAAETLSKLVEAGIMDQATARAAWLARGQKGETKINDPRKAGDVRKDQGAATEQPAKPKGNSTPQGEGWERVMIDDPKRRGILLPRPSGGWPQIEVWRNRLTGQIMPIE